MRSRQRGFFGLEGAALYAVVGLGAALLLSWAGAGLAVWYLDGKVDKAQEQVAEAQEEATKARERLAKEEQSRAGFQAAAGSCSASVAALESRAAQAERELAKREKESKVLTGAVQAHVRALLNRPRPEGLDECQAMKKELQDEIDFRASNRPAS